MTINKSIFKFGTKSETLNSLARLLDRKFLLDQIYFTHAEWSKDSESIIIDILSKFSNKSLAIRSSAIGEDSHDTSMAGAFDSFINIAPEEKSIREAVDKVFESYDELSTDNQVLIQPMVENVVISGVLLTRDLDTGSPYYVINYDDISGRTDSVTSGIENKCILVHHNSVNDVKSGRFRKLINIVRSIQKITEYDELDIEFCITSDENVFILQVRPLAAKSKWAAIDYEYFDDCICSIREKVEKLSLPESGLSGSSNIFGEMPDWNPAEMIGNSPRALSLSLYRYLITDHAWSVARSSMGYKNIGSMPLLIDFCGRPYIDVRKSLNSFLPSGIDHEFSNSLIDYQIQKLRNNPNLHDKIEFDIAITCRDFKFGDHKSSLIEAGFSLNDIDDLGNRLLKLTYNCIETDLDNLFKDTDKLAESRMYAKQCNPDLAIKILLDNCIKYGTIPFSKLARHAFIGISFLKTAVLRGAISKKVMNDFMQSIATVATDISNSIFLLSKNDITQKYFLEKFGHLRPGTYDILSYRYDEKPELYLGKGKAISHIHREFKLTKSQKEALNKLLNEEGYEISAPDLLNYIAKSVRLRESAKFEFTHNISDALVLICDLSKEYGLTREDMSNIEITELLMHFDDPSMLKELAKSGANKHLITRSIRLPHLITSPEDVSVVRLPLGRPTFISGKKSTGPIICLNSEHSPNIDGHIVLIESADPGFDWIFSRNILGLITKYGGANSHMAIRCAEFGLPAAIGCGERLFETISQCNKIILDCSSHDIKVIN